MQVTKRHRARGPQGIARWWVLLLLLVGSGLGQTVGQETTQPSPTERTAPAKRLTDIAPRDSADLRALQRQVQKLTKDIFACTVAVQVGRASGSGVIVSEDGYVLTAAHVAGAPNEFAVVHLADGRKARAVTLGMNPQLDAGLIKITDEGPWPFAPIGKSAEVTAGQWCLATGHPGGYDAQRLPVLRLGRVLRAEASAILSDCTLVGGDSGGPLFNLHGQVIGIHSRIGKNLTINVHVPVDPFRESWTRLVKGETWGDLDEAVTGWIGVTEDRQAEERGAKVRAVLANSPAARAGIQPGDVVVEVGGAAVDNFQTLQQLVRSMAPGERVQMIVQRQGTRHTLELTIGSRSDGS